MGAGKSTLVKDMIEQYQSPLEEIDLHLLFDGAEIEVVLAREPVILNAINVAYDRGLTSTDELAEEAEDDLDSLATELSNEPKDLLESTDDAPIIRLVNSMMQHAAQEAMGGDGGPALGWQGMFWGRVPPPVLCCTQGRLRRD